MLFNLEVDSGDAIVLYFVPDGAAGVATIIARSNGEEVLSLAANETRQALVDAGRHQTGECGFRIHEGVLPGLAGMANLEFYDPDTNLLIYRRPDPGHLRKKILRIETHLFPLWRLDDALKPRFQYFARGIEALGRETTTQLFLLNHVNSVYLSGRVLYNNYRNYIESHFETIFVMHHPYEEMAERLLVLGQIKKLGAGVLGMRDGMSLHSTIEFAQSLPVHDEDALRKALYKMPASVAHALSNPVVRQLTARAPDEMPPGRAVSTALDILASFTVVGLRRQPETILSAVAEMTESDTMALPDFTKFRSVGSLARALKRSRIVEPLLEKDLELYDHVASAFKKLQ
jgi:hypothetical protein